MSPATPDSLALSLPSHPRFLPVVRAAVDAGAEAAGFGETDRNLIALAVTEGLTNVIRHGYGGCTDERIDVRLSFPRGVIQVEIEDYGCYVEPDRIRSRDLGEVRPGGLGVHLMQTTMDEVRYNRNEHGGTTLTLRKQCRALPSDEETS